MSRAGLDENTWLRARAWALWKATFELYNEVKDSREEEKQKQIIQSVLE